MSGPYEHPFVSVVSRFLQIYLRLLGWRFAGEIPREAKFVAIVAPHTSNWDFFIALEFAIVKGVTARWFGKHTIFRWPFTSILRSLGGIPLNRSASRNAVEEAVSLFAAADRLIMAMSPEGTRKYTDRWKSGFYHIAQEAKVPVLLVYLDYGKRIVGAGPLIWLTGDIEGDMGVISAFYGAVSGKYPAKSSAICIKKVRRAG